MSSQKDGFLQAKSSYSFQRERETNYRSKTIDPQAFQAWSNNYMYQTSYSKHHGQGVVGLKNTAIPGYTGHVPSAKSDNYHGKTFTATAKDCFSQKKLGQNPYGLSTTGFNINRQALIDKTQKATSSRYGKSSIQSAHKAWQANSYKSTAHQHFGDPRKVQSPTFRPTDKNTETWQANTKASGFSRNNTEGDGKGWKPDPVLTGNPVRTEYRDRFNADHPFHRNVNISKSPKLQQRQLNYVFT